MEPITNNEFLNSVLEAEVWKEISDNESLSMDILDKYADKLDWDEISENRNVIWTLDGINKFTNRLNWSNFSENCPDHIINEVTLQKFATRWDWKAISNRDCFYNDWALLEKFADKLYLVCCDKGRERSEEFAYSEIFRTPDRLPSRLQNQLFVKKQRCSLVREDHCYL